MIPSPPPGGRMDAKWVVDEGWEVVVEGGRRVLVMVMLARGVGLVEARDASDTMMTMGMGAAIACMLCLYNCV